MLDRSTVGLTGRRGHLLDKGPRSLVGWRPLRAIGQQRFEPVNRLVRTILEQAPVARQRERRSVVTGPLGDLPHVASSGYEDRDEAVPKTVKGEPVQSCALDRRPLEVPRKRQGPAQAPAGGACPPYGPGRAACHRLPN